MTDMAMLDRYRHAVLSHRPGAPLSPDLLIEDAANLSMYYSPFEHVNPLARVVFVGITPGLQQAENALAKAADELRNGAEDAVVLRSAKAFASFSGPMRANLVACLDTIGLHGKLDLPSCAAAFSTGSDLAHFTSVLRYPTFLDGANFSGKPEILRTPMLKAAMEQWFATELDIVRDAVWVPLGPTPTAVLEYLAVLGKIPRSRIFAGLPHPSGANAERISYFLGRKDKSALSPKTDPVKLDRAKSELMGQVAAL